MRDDLASLLSVVRGLLDRDGFTEVQAVTDVWLTLLCHDPRQAAFAGATAIVQLAKRSGGEPHHREADKAVRSNPWGHRRGCGGACWSVWLPGSPQQPPRR